MFSSVARFSVRRFADVAKVPATEDPIKKIFVKSLKEYAAKVMLIKGTGLTLYIYIYLYYSFNIYQINLIET